MLFVYKILSFCNIFVSLDSAVYVGSTNEDEMCNFYMMYWVEGKIFLEINFTKNFMKLIFNFPKLDKSYFFLAGPEVMKQKSCFSLGPPAYSWGGWILGGGLSNIPDEEASSF